MTAPRRPPRRPAGSFAVVGVAALAAALAFLALPLFALVADAGPGELVSALGDDGALEALRLSLETSALAVLAIVVIGTPAAWILATRRFPGRAIALTVIELPLVVPPAAAGVALLAAFGPHGLGLQDQLVFQTAGVVVALAFVASPFYVRAAVAAFEAVDPRELEVSRTLGAGEARTFARVAVPSAASGLAAGLALAWGRALGEFGATLLFAGSLRGVTQTAPLAIYERFGTDFTSAEALSVVLVAVAAAVLLGVKLLAAR